MHSLGSAGERGSEITGDVEKYLIKGYLPTIGIECHVQLATATKLFSSVDNDARGQEPNAVVSAIDYALPGMLPMLNKEAVRLAARAGKALNSEIAHESRFDRKHYFYPDLPKGYQISQMYQPIIIGGFVELPSGEKIRIHHAHMEEDAAKLTHYSDYSLVDLNRAGTPLLEIVAEPDIHSAAGARAYAEELHLLMTYAGVTLGDLYYGNMRFDVNISVAKPGEKLGIRTETKNLNSFRSVEKAVEYEINRQIAILEDGGAIKQETRGWLDDAQKTVSQRSKENAQDYRYMPDADIPPIILTDAEISELQKDMPILPNEYRAKFAALKVDDSVIRTILRDQNIAKLLAEILDTAGADAAKKIANLFVSTLPAEDEEAGADDDATNLPVAQNLIKLASMLDQNEISSTAGKEIFIAMLGHDDDPRKIAETKNLLQVSDESAISAIVDEVLNSPECAKAVADFRSGEEKVIGFLVGQVMKASKGQANPALAQKLIREKLQ
ncbi:Asp-tRNA(Asn)/Glu-tRNA(Gln) amidotransferase subunit GatB [Candidatus Saccharibacteria bacterium]|nr:Asp-tRNA(Asn)/Glu-tRNA(Gln) amidotransferase subunit GatB [Candidatus Saccharibacteria bacterium]MCL1963006.1 Asp-tRNA(Asn)/Glu-tRNA(Gln) amidotransferase subunit GatB [Candidatus Saccharibacteria bacterium]